MNAILSTFGLPVIIGGYGLPVIMPAVVIGEIETYLSIFAHDSASMTTAMVFGSVEQDPIVEFTPTVTTGLTVSLGITTVIISIGGNDSGSVDTGFYSGSITQVILPIYGGNDTSSVDTGFYSGSIVTVVIATNQAEAAAIITGLISGSCA